MADLSHVPDWNQVHVGDEITGAFVLHEKTRRTGKRGDYLVIRLTNERGQSLVGKVWSEHVDAFDVFEEGDALMISGKVDKGWPPDENPPPELKVVSFQRIEGPHPVRDAMNPVYPGDLDVLKAEFDRLISEIRDPGYRRFVELVFSGETRERFFRAPAAVYHHHNYIGGLLEHTLEVTRFSLQAADAPMIAPHVNRDLVIGGGLVHDLGKLDEYAFEGVPIGITSQGYLYNHMISGPLRLKEVFLAHKEELEALNFTSVDLDQFIHIQASHHGKLEWGANVTPATVAAQCVHQGDLMSAAIRGMTGKIESISPTRDGLVKTNRMTIVLDPRSPARNEALAAMQSAAMEKALEATYTAEADAISAADMHRQFTPEPASRTR